MKIKQTEAELKRQLADQLELLQELASAYDSGKHVVAKSMSTVIRVLLHDTAKSHSLLDQLNLKNGNFFDTIGGIKHDANTQRIGSFAGILGVQVGAKDSNDYLPYLDEGIPSHSAYVPFKEYWERVIFIDNSQNAFSRKEVVLFLSNQDGGAHVAPEVEEKYIQLARNNSLGMHGSTDEKSWEYTGAEHAAIRQISHELLRTLIPTYPHQKPVHSAPIMIGGLGIRIGHSSVPTYKNIGRNEPCPCGRQRKFKKCCGK